MNCSIVFNVLSLDFTGKNVDLSITLVGSGKVSCMVVLSLGSTLPTARFTVYLFERVPLQCERNSNIFCSILHSCLTSFQ